MVASSTLDLVPELLVGVPLEDLEVSLGDVVAALEHPEGAVDSDGEINSADAVVVAIGTLNGSVGKEKYWLFQKSSNSTISRVDSVLGLALGVNFVKSSVVVDGGFDGVLGYNNE